MVEKYSIARIPAFNLMKPDFRRSNNLQVLGMGTLEFSQAQLESLPAVPVELNKIIQDLRSGKRFINQQFTIKNLQKQRQKQLFGILHLATYAEFNPGKPEESYIQFWANERMKLNEIEQLKLDQPTVDLLVLSACRTADFDDFKSLFREILNFEF